MPKSATPKTPQTGNNNKTANNKNEPPREPPNPYVFFLRAKTPVKDGKKGAKKTPEDAAREKREGTWQELGDSEKKEYERERALEYLRYQRELAEYYELHPDELREDDEEEEEEKVGIKRKRLVKLSGYLLFQREQQQRIKENVKKDVKGSNFITQTSLEWNALDPKKREYYRKKAIEENNRLESLELKVNEKKEEVVEEDDEEDIEKDDLHEDTEVQQEDEEEDEDNNGNGEEEEEEEEVEEEAEEEEEEEEDD